MNQKIIAIAVAIIVLGGGAYLLSQKKTGDVASDGSSAEKQGEVKNSSNSLKGMLAENKNQMCTFSSEEDGRTDSGTVYFGRNQFRTDIFGTNNDQETTSHMIYDGELVSIWTDGEPDGFQMSLDATTAPEQNDQPKSFDPEKEVDFKCESWTPDSSKFELPSNVNFQNVSEIMKGLGLPQDEASGSSNQPKLDSSVCDQLPAESKAACLSAIGQ